MGEAAKKDDEEEKFIPVGPGADEVPEADKKKDEPEEDKRLAQKDDEDEREERKPPERHKETSKERRERAKKAAARDRLERDFLLKRNEELEKRLMGIESRQSQTEGAAIDQRVTAIKAQIVNADRVMADAMRKPNGGGAEEFIEAQKIRDELRDQLAELSASKKVHQQRTEQELPARREETGKPDPRVIRHAREWASNHDWFSFDGEDEDSRIVRAIDEALTADGFDPKTQDYWDELTDRVKRRLPERYKKGAKARPDDEDEDEPLDEDEDRAARPSGPRFSSGGRERPLKKGEVYVSAERKQAMKEYGVWDDPTARNRMLKKYAQWDAEFSASNKR